MTKRTRGFIAQRAIGSGFQSVLYADCQNVEDVKECVKITRADTPEDGGSYGVCNPPILLYGIRGWNLNYVQALRDVVVVIMIEKKGTVENLEEVLSVEGVDMIQWGGSDYSMSIGKGRSARVNSEIQETEQRVFKTALKMGVPPRAEIGSADGAKRFLDMGVRHFCIGTDISILYGWWREHGDGLTEGT